MNGDIGIIMNFIYKDRAISGVNVLFDSGFVEYTLEEMEDLKLAYAISVHKSQGSEFDTVIVPFVTEHRFMLRRKLIYTAVTRAKKHLVMLGNLQRLYFGISRIEEPRQTILSQKIIEAIQNKKIAIDDVQSAFSTLGEKAYGNNNPYDFEP
jgi:exodeoxyribonuclease V alpha subunit